MAAKIYYPGERAALAIRECKRISAKLAEHALETCILLGKLRGELAEISRVNTDPEIRKLIDRIDELQQLENRQELQSWTITMNRVMDAAWRDLP